MGEKCFTTAPNTSCRGDFSFKTLVFPCPVCDIFRPARSDGGHEREKVRPAHEKWPKLGGLWRAGRVFSRKCRWRGCAGRSFSRGSCCGAVPGAFVEWQSLLVCSAWEALPRYREHPGPRCWLSVWYLDAGLVPPLDLGCATDPRSRAQDLGYASRRGHPKEPQVDAYRPPFRRIPVVSSKMPLTPISRGA